MKAAQRHTRERLPASCRQIGITIGLAALMIVAGCGSQPSLSDLPYHHAATTEQCRDGSTMFCTIRSPDVFGKGPMSSCRCQFIDEYQDRYQRASTRRQLRRRHPRQ